MYTFLYYANKESDDVIAGSPKTVQHSIKTISRNIKVVFFKFGTTNLHHKRNRMTPTMFKICTICLELFSLFLLSCCKSYSFLLENDIIFRVYLGH